MASRNVGTSPFPSPFSSPLRDSRDSGKGGRGSARKRQRSRWRLGPLVWMLGAAFFGPAVLGTLRLLQVMQGRGGGGSGGMIMFSAGAGGGGAAGQAPGGGKGEGGGGEDEDEEDSPPPLVGDRSLSISPDAPKLLDAGSQTLGVAAALRCYKRNCDKKVARSLRGHHLSWVFKSQHATQGGIRYMHMAVVERLSNGRFIAAWQGSSVYEGDSDQEIWYVVSADKEGKSWGPPKKVPYRGIGARWSPVLHFHKTDDEPLGKIVLFFCESNGCLRPPPAEEPDRPRRWAPGGDIKTMTLENPTTAQAKWSRPRMILSRASMGGISKVIANRVTVLSTGEWLLPYWRERHLVGECNTSAPPAAGVLRSHNQGLSWQPHGWMVHPRTWLIENTATEIGGGRVLMIFRTNAGFLFYSHSRDGGKSWDAPEPTNLPNPDSKIQVLRLRSGHLALVFNAHRKLKHSLRRVRSLLDVAVSGDDGRTWQRIARLDDELDPGLRIHYPTMIQARGMLYVIFSKFYHEKYMGRGANRTDLGIRMMSVDISRQKMPVLAPGAGVRAPAPDSSEGLGGPLAADA